MESGGTAGGTGYASYLGTQGGSEDLLTKELQHYIHLIKWLKMHKRNYLQQDHRKQKSRYELGFDRLF